MVVKGVTYQQDTKGENLRIPPISLHIFWPISLLSAPLLISIFWMSDASQCCAFWELQRDTVQMTPESHELNCTDPLIHRFFHNICTTWSIVGWLSGYRTPDMEGKTVNLHVKLWLPGVPSALKGSTALHLLQVLCTCRYCKLSFLLISYCLSICFLISESQLFLIPAVSHSGGNGELLF